MIWILLLFVALAGIGAWLISKSMTVRLIALSAAALAAAGYWIVGKPGMADQPYARRVAELEVRAKDPAKAGSLRFDELVALMKHRAEADPKDPGPHFSLAQLYDVLGRQAEGQIEYEEGLARAPSFAKRLAELDKLPPATLAEQLSKGQMQPDEVVALLEYRAWQTPSDPTQRINLAGLYEQIRQPEQARMAYEAALGRAPDNPKALAGLAGLLFRATGQFSPDIASLYRKAYAKAPDDPAVGIMVALDEWRQGRKAEAEKMWADILAKLPPDDRLRTMYGVIRSRFAPADGAAPAGEPAGPAPANPAPAKPAPTKPD